jgi:hypothetical protein
MATAHARQLLTAFLTIWIVTFSRSLGLADLINSATTEGISACGTEDKLNSGGQVEVF